MTVKNTKPGPLRWIFNQARGLFRRLRGERETDTVEPDPKLRDRYTSREAESGAARGLIGRLKAGEISVQRWVLDFRAQVKEVFVNQYMAARGGRQAMTQADWGSLGGMLKKQYEHVQRFGEALAQDVVSEAQAKVRADMYVKAATQAFERGDAARHGVRAELPAYPGDGSTQCMTNCQCTWEIREREDRFDAYWRLGEAEHCDDCVRRAREWAPYVVPKVSNG